jgi:hypothetical protein
LAEYAPPDDPVFQLVPPAFNDRANKLYADLGRPVVSSGTFWTIYLDLLHRFQDGEDAQFTTVLASHHNTMLALEQESAAMQLLPNMKPFRNGDNLIGPRGQRYIGGLPNPPTTGLQGSPHLTVEGMDSDSAGGDAPQPEYADFTTDEDEDTGAGQ